MSQNGDDRVPVVVAVLSGKLSSVSIPFSRVANFLAMPSSTLDSSFISANSSAYQIHNEEQMIQPFQPKLVRFKSET